MTDNETPADLTDDRLASFSSTGPSYEGFVKPEVLAPGGHMLGLMDSDSTLPEDYPQFYDGAQYFTMSGTSQAAAVVSGVVALMLTADDSLTPDDVKCRLLDASRPFTNPDGTLAYSIFQQGAGVINAYDAVHSTATGCANQGMDIDLDLGDVYHYGGRASMDAYGNYFIMGLDGDGYTWDGTFYSTSGYPWSNGYIFTDGYTFTDGYLFTDGTINADGYIWTDGYTFTDGYPWTNGYIFTDGYPFTDAYPFTDTLFEPMSVNVWVAQE
jgi:subtilisin family serine protease